MAKKAKESSDALAALRTEFDGARDQTGTRLDGIESNLAAILEALAARAPEPIGDAAAGGSSDVDGGAGDERAGDDAGSERGRAGGGARRGDRGRRAVDRDGGGDDRLSAGGGGPFDDPDDGGGGDDRGGDMGGDGTVRHSRDYRWPSERTHYGDFKVGCFDKDEMAECVPGFAQLREAERMELVYWYPISAKINSICANLERGLLRGDEQCIRDDLRDCAEQAKPRIVYLNQCAKSASKRSSYSRAYWRDHALDDLEDRRGGAVSGTLGAKHQKTRQALLTARAKVNANAEAKRQRWQATKDSKGGGGDVP